MSLMGVLTVLFVVLKLVGVISWSWWLVLSPLLISFGIYLVFFFVWITTSALLFFKR